MKNKKYNNLKERGLQERWWGKTTWYKFHIRLKNEHIDICVKIMSENRIY